VPTDVPSSPRCAAFHAQYAKPGTSFAVSLVHSIVFYRLGRVSLRIRARTALHELKLSSVFRTGPGIAHVCHPNRMTRSNSLGYILRANCRRFGFWNCWNKLEPSSALNGSV